MYSSQKIALALLLISAGCDAAQQEPETVVIGVPGATEPQIVNTVTEFGQKEPQRNSSTTQQGNVTHSLPSSHGVPPQPVFPVSHNYNIQVSTLPIPYEPRYFTDRTRSDMVEFLDRATRDIEFAESQISLATEFARAALNHDVNDSKNFVIKNHEKDLNTAAEYFIDEDVLWECAKNGEKIIEAKAKIMTNRVNDCIKRASSCAMDVVSSTKSHVAEDRTRRLQKYAEDVKRLTSCMKQQDRQCVREQSSLIDRNVEGLAADARAEVERVREARRQQVAEFGVCRRFQDQSYIEMMNESDKIIELCIKKARASAG